MGRYEGLKESIWAFEEGLAFHRASALRETAKCFLLGTWRLSEKLLRWHVLIISHGRFEAV